MFRQTAAADRRPGGALSETEAIGLQGLAADEMAGEAERAIGIVCRVGVCYLQAAGDYAVVAVELKDDHVYALRVERSNML